MATKNIGKPEKKVNHVIDATDRPLGRLATEVAVILQGKDTPDYVPYLPGKNTVTIQNGAKIKVSGKKATDKKYYRHSGYIGNLKEMTFEQIFSKNPKRVIELAVKNMLPNNKLRQRWMNRLKIEI